MFRSCFVLCFVILSFNLSISYHQKSLFSQGNLLRYLNSHLSDVKQNVVRRAKHEPERSVMRSWNGGSSGPYSSHVGSALEGLKVSKNMSKDEEERRMHVAMMGRPNEYCDDGFSNLAIDWDGDPVFYTCYEPKHPLPILKVWTELSESNNQTEVEPVMECDNVPNGYWPKHICMDEEIVYKSILPTHENHRPLWAVFGEYVYLPPQRWLHNVEHGSVVMLYHPCAEPAIIQELKSILKSCIRKHVITANALLPKKMPLALVAWGCRLLMNSVDVPTVVDFIKKHGRTGPEGYLVREGQYNLTLLETAVIPPGSDFNDSKLCPTYS